MVKKLFKQFVRNTQAGVTLIEMLVVVAIVALVSSVILFNYSDFSTNVSVRNLAQEVALAIRKAQTYATSVRTVGNSGLSSDTYPAYGISFAIPQHSTQTSYAPNSKQFNLFADVPELFDGPGNMLYEFSSGVTNCGESIDTNECVENFTINTSDKIAAICINGATYPEDCLKEEDGAIVDISFARPNPDALFCLHDGDDQCDESINISSVGIVLKSAKDAIRTITVYTTGQISVQ